MIKKSIFLVGLVAYIILFQGCVVGSIVSVPFKVTGEILPTPVGDGISIVGETVETLMPF